MKIVVNMAASKNWMWNRGSRKNIFSSPKMGQGGSSYFEEHVLHRLNAHEKKVTCCSVAPDGKTLATCSADGNINLWNLSTGELLHTLADHKKEVTSLSFSGPVMASSSKDGLVFLWQYQTSNKQPKPRRSSRLALHRGAVLQCVFSRDGKALASVSADRTGRLYKIRPGAGEFVPGTEIKELEGHTAQVNAVQFSPDSSVLVTGSDDTTIRIWEKSQGKCVRTLYTQGPVTKLCFSPFDGNRDTRVHVACISANRIEVWNMAEYEKRQELDFPTEKQLTAIAYVPDGKYLVSTHSENSVVVWDPLASVKPTIKRTGNKEGIYSCCFNSTGQIFVVGDGVGSVHIWGEQEDDKPSEASPFSSR